MAVQVATVRLYLDLEDGDTAEDFLADALCPPSSGLIDEEERDEVLAQVWGAIVVDEHPATPVIDSDAIIAESAARRSRENGP